MKDQSRTKQVLIQELSSLRQRIAELEQSESELKRAEEALRRSEERFNLSMQATRDGLWDWKIKTDEGYFSPGYYHMLGYEVGDFPVKGNAWKELIHPDDCENALRANIDCIEGRCELFEVEFRMKAKNGEWRWVLGRGKCVARDEQGCALRLVGTHVDVTDRKRAEESLRESEEKYRSLFENAYEAIFVAQNGKLVFLNPMTTIIIGYSSEELLASPFIEFIHTDDREMVIDKHIRRLKGDELPHRYPFRIIHRNGNVMWVELNAVLINWMGQAATLNFMSDITERKRMEDAIQMSEDRAHQQRIAIARLAVDDAIASGDVPTAMQRLTEEASAAIQIERASVWLLSEDDKNLRCITLFEANAKKHSEGAILKSEDYPRYFEAIRARSQINAGDARTDPRTSEFTADYLIPLEITSMLDAGIQMEGKLAGVVCFEHVGEKRKWHPDEEAFASTIAALVAQTLANAERKRVEETLRESEELFRVSMERAPDGVYMNDLEGIFLYGNRRAEEIIGYSREELIGRNFLDFNIIAEDSVDKAIDLLKANREGKSTGPDELELVRKDGRHILIEINTNVLQRRGKKDVLAFLRDITERRQIEEERQSLEERLQRAEKMEALGTLAGGVAHDLNNVLGIIVGYAELLLMNADKSSSLRPQLVNIMNGGQRAAAIVDDLLTLARRGVSGREVLNLNKIIADCQQSPEFEKLSSYHSPVKIRTDIEPNLLNISGSSVHLGKTLFNLVSNASEAMPKGGILTIKTANQYLDKPLHGYDEVREGDYVILSVSDTGEGIPVSDLKRIFEPFYTKKVMGRSGTGLGLAVVWGTVKDHHGYINVQSEEGKGSVFTLYFPVTREDISSEVVAVASSEYMGRGESILVVDDVKEQRELAASMLRTLNYNVSSVPSGEEAVAYLQEQQIDLMLLDMIMDPGMDGLDTYRIILDIHPKQKAIIVSGFSESDRVKAAQSLGAGAYVKKPYVIEKLGLAVRKELDRK